MRTPCASSATTPSPPSRKRRRRWARCAPSKTVEGAPVLGRVPALGPPALGLVPGLRPLGRVRTDGDRGAGAVARRRTPQRPPPSRHLQDADGPPGLGP